MKPTRESIQQLLDLPEQINACERTINGLRSDKAKQERKQKAIEARLRLSERVKSEPNAEDRKAALVLECEDHPEWQKVTSRLEELAGMIRATEAQRDLLRRTRAGLQVQAGLYIVQKLEEAAKDKDIVAAVGGKWLA